MEPSWIDSYYEALEFFYLEPQHLARKWHEKIGFKTADRVNDHLGQIEVTLNQNLHQFFALAPYRLRDALHAHAFARPGSQEFRLFGRGVDGQFDLDNTMQPDLLFTSDVAAFSIEMKVGAQSTVSQVLKYALLGLAVELKTGRRLDHYLMLLGRGD